MPLILRAALSLGILIPGLLLSRRPSAEKRVQRGNAWARKHLAYVDAGLVGEFDRLLDARRRQGRWLISALAVLIVLIPMSFTAGVWAAAAAMFVVSTIVSTVFLIRWVSAMEPGPRVARGRRVELGDLMSPRIRMLMWGSLGALLVLAGLSVGSGAPAGATTFVTTMLVLLGCSALALEALGRVLAHAPEPAIDAAHLYWQDVMRSEVVTTHAQQIALGAASACGVLWQSGPWQLAPWVVGSAVVASFVLMGLVVVAGFGELFKPVAHVRSKLWPGLLPNQVVGPAAQVVG